MAHAILNDYPEEKFCCKIICEELNEGEVLWWLIIPLTSFTYVTGKRGNVEINNSPQAGIEPGTSRFKIQHSTEWAKEISH